VKAVFLRNLPENFQNITVAVKTMGRIKKNLQAEGKWRGLEGNS